jgi:16S rRNA (cytidine1402-2'-O)-methyltransferase
MQELAPMRTVLVFYESPHRLSSFLRDGLEIFGNIPCVVSKEMTKRFERFYRGRLEDVIKRIEEDGIRGEYTAIFDNRRRK